MGAIPAFALGPEHTGEYCPVRATLSLLGHKWVPRIVYELRDGKRRFNELAVVVGGCNSRTLRDRLEALESLQIVSRTIVHTMPPWVEYALTDRGRELADALEPLGRWGERYRPAIEAHASAAAGAFKRGAA